MTASHVAVDVTARPSRLVGFIRLARLRFLLYNVLPVGLGASVAVWEGHPFNVFWYVVAQLFAWCTHLMTHYSNEYFDLDADRANTHFTPWTGGSRALVDGLVSPKVALGTSFVLWAAAMLLVAAMPTTLSRVLAAVTVALAWFYTAPPLAANYRGLGELTVAAILNGLWPAVAVVLLAGHVPVLLLAVLAPSAILQTVRMMIMNLGDRVSDAAVGKRTIPVIIGYDRAVAVIIGGQVAAYGLLAGFALLGWVPWLVALAMFATAPISGWLVMQLSRGQMRDVEPAAMTPVVFWASNHVSLIVAAAMVGMLGDAVLHRGSSGLGVNVLVTVLAAYGVLFAHRLWLATRRRVTVSAPTE